MRSLLSLLLVPLALAACGDATAPLSPTDALQARGGIPGAPGGITLQSLTASINRPGTVGNYTTCTFSASVSGGTAPYTYAWGISGASGGYLSPQSYNTASIQATGYYYGSWGGTGSVYLYVTVTDANGLQATPYRQILIPYSSTSC
ncbi:hypothetical protein [Longimicrobium sp.]|uniref:hypothetical protein n=1 Tax=Longimicrobium sp. TaxID=2029185 RepID=UPI002E365EC7|nr:hypothetical protein [Longimicrobium sp.]HEX6036908.1 hypothetical protein [Longimicrobium sp.]